jgi:hypothetical protein
MEKLQANIFKGEELLFENITIYISELSSVGFHKEWRGFFGIPISERIESGELYHIELDDGRVGNFLISNITITFPDLTKVHIVSSGPLR